MTTLDILKSPDDVLVLRGEDLEFIYAHLRKDPYDAQLIPLIQAVGHVTAVKAKPGQDLLGSPELGSALARHWYIGDPPSEP